MLSRIADAWNPIAPEASRSARQTQQAPRRQDGEQAHCQVLLLLAHVLHPVRLQELGQTGARPLGAGQRANDVWEDLRNSN